MNLRTVTIWMTGLLSLGALCIIFAGVIVGLYESRLTVGSVCTWIIFSAPLHVSWLVARRLKYVASMIVLLVPTVICGILYILTLLTVLSSHSHFCDCRGILAGVLMLLLLSVSILFLIFAWITALVIEIRHRKKKTEP